MDILKDLEKDLHDRREYFDSGRTREASWREAQLHGLSTFLDEKEGDILSAVKKDLGKHHAEVFRDEIGTLRKSLNLAKVSLKAWMSPKKAKLPKIALLSSAEIVPEPLGLVLIFSSWDFPFGLSLEPLIGAITAGNTVVLKPSEISSACSYILSASIPSYLDSKAIKVVEGGPDMGEQLLQHKWDKIFFTGSPRVGRMVMSAAANHLTPVTLELGGKCPAVVDSLSSSWDEEAAVKRILVGKFGTCAGQACIAIDYVLVEKKFSSTLVKQLTEWMKKMFGENPRESNSVARIINKRQFSRLKKLLHDPDVRHSVIHGGSLDEDNLLIEPTILLDPPLESQIMNDVIFGPLLPIVTLDKIEDSIPFIESQPKPVAVYVFSKDKTLQRRMVNETSSGSLVINDTAVQYAADTLPFGGVGESGFGNYRGKFSFDTFSHMKAVVRRSFLSDFWFRYPPWNDYKLPLLEAAYNLDYIGLLLVILRLRRTKQTSVAF